MMRKAVLILSIVMAFEASAACDEKGYFDCGTTGDVKWYVSSDQKTLTIAGNGAIGDYENASDRPYNQYRNKIENIIVSEGVTAIGEKALGNMRNVTNVSLPNTLTTIGRSALSNLAKLTNIELPNSLVSIGDGAFIHNVNLQSIIIPDSVTSIGDQAFYNAIRLQSLIIPASVTTIGAEAFGDKSNEEYDIAGNVYCEQPSEGKSPCSSKHLGLLQDRFGYYTKDDKGVISFNGQKYSSLEKLSKQIPIRRIYTIEEASEAVGKKNSVIIKYK